MGKFTINFGDAKELEPPEEGPYELVVHSYKCFEAKEEDSRQNGFNVGLQFKIADRPDLEKLTIFHNLWVMHSNPFAAKAFFSAVYGYEVEMEEFDAEAVDLVGAHVGAFISHREIKSKVPGGKPRLVPEIPEFNCFYHVE